jgi:hypothetical protein
MIKMRQEHQCPTSVKPIGKVASARKRVGLNMLSGCLDASPTRGTTRKAWHLRLSALTAVARPPVVIPAVCDYSTGVE